MLLVRKECEEILNSYGLDMLHVERNSDLKCLSLVGECGKPLVNIHGISMPTNSLNEERRIYAIKLFDRFMTKHHKLIQDLVKAKKDFISKPKPISKIGKFDFWRDDTTLTVKSYKFAIKEKDLVICQYEYKTIDELMAYLKSKEIQEIKKELEYANNYRAEENELIKKEQEVNSCAI